MYANKLNYLLRLDDFPVEDQNKFVGYVLQYHEATKKKKPNPLVRVEDFVIQKIANVNQLVGFLQTIRYHYLNSEGNLITFKNRMIKQSGHGYLLLFNGLVGVKAPIDKIIVFSYLDKLLTQMILGWCSMKKANIHLAVLFQIIDAVNGDHQIVKR